MKISSWESSCRVYIQADFGSNMILRASMAARGDLSDFEWGVIVDARLASTLVSKAVEIVNVARVTFSKVMSAWEKRRKDIIEGQQWAEVHD